MARYRVEVTKKKGKVRDQSAPVPSFGQAHSEALRLKGCGWTTIIVTRDSEGEDHPDNAGKFFLDRIVK